MSRIALLCLVLLVLLPSCGNPAKRQAAKEFRGALAAMKVACHGTLEEFRESEVKLDIAFEANKELLPVNAAEYAMLHELLSYCRLCWMAHILRGPGYVISLDPVIIGRRLDKNAAWSDVHRDDSLIWLAMVFINPRLQRKTMAGDSERAGDPDFTIEPTLARGLAQASQICQGFMDRLAR